MGSLLLSDAMSTRAYRRLSLFVAFIMFLAVSAIGCSRSAQPSGNPDLDLLLLSLNSVGGQFTWEEDLGMYTFSHSVQLDEDLSIYELEPTIRKLVNCIDNQTPSTSTLEGRPVALGVVCYQALTQLVYYEPVDVEGDIEVEWGGYITPDASATERERAKQAWLKVLQENSYMVL